MPQAKIGVIGGSGLYQMEGMTDIEEVEVETPFGKPSDVITIGKVEGVPMYRGTLNGDLDIVPALLRTSATYLIGRRNVAHCCLVCLDKGAKEEKEEKQHASAGAERPVRAR